jgi:hypothetical protein
MRVVLTILVIALACATSSAGNRKVLVLPVDGNAPAAQRSTINESVVKLAKDGMEGDVSAGDTTFNETATAVGCAPDQPACADTVMTTLSVDELVWSDAKVDNGSTTLTVHRQAKGEPARQQVLTLDPKANGDAVYGGMAPLFARETVGEGSGSGSGSGEGSGSAAAPLTPHHTFFDTTERKLAVGLAAGSAVAIIIGLSFWNNESTLQDDIDGHRINTVADFQDLKALEDRAASKALWGNIFVVVGLGLGGASGYYFYKDHKNRNATVLAPAPTETGTGVTMVLRGRW